MSDLFALFVTFVMFEPSGQLHGQKYQSPRGCRSPEDRLAGDD